MTKIQRYHTHHVHPSQTAFPSALYRAHVGYSQQQYQLFETLCLLRLCGEAKSFVLRILPITQTDSRFYEFSTA